MDKDFERKYFESERDHWWFLGRRDAIRRIIGKCERGINILDIGCGGGSLLRELESQGFKNLAGIDISPHAIEVCRRRKAAGGNVFVMDGHNPSIEDSSYDMIIASDILEHLSDDRLALKNFYRILKPGGTLLVFVPAYRFLWSGFDEINHHYRRYSRNELEGKIAEAGFRIKKTGSWNFTLFFPAVLIHFVKKITGGSDPGNFKKNFLLDIQYLLLNKVLSQLLFVENKFLFTPGLPAGLSIFALAEKPRQDG